MPDGGGRFALYMVVSTFIYVYTAHIGNPSHIILGVTHQLRLETLRPNKQDKLRVQEV